MKKGIVLVIILYIFQLSCEQTTKSKNNDEVDTYFSILGEVNKVRTFDLTLRAKNYTPQPLELPDTINSRTKYLDSLYNSGVLAYGHYKYINTFVDDTLYVKKLLYDCDVYTEIMNELEGIPQSEITYGENNWKYVLEDSIIYRIGNNDNKSIEYVLPFEIGNTYKSDEYGNKIFTIEKDTIIKTPIGNFSTYKIINTGNIPEIKFVNPDIGLVRTVQRYKVEDINADTSNTSLYMGEVVEELISIEDYLE